MAQYSQPLPNLKKCKFQQIGSSSNTTVYRCIPINKQENNKNDDDQIDNNNNDNEDDEDRNLTNNFSNLSIKYKNCCALKAVKHREHGVCEDECHDLENEYSLLKNLDHPHIVKVHENFKNAQLFSNDSKTGCQIIMELAICDGIELVNNPGQNRKALDLLAVQNIFWQICKGVNYLHSRDVTHNDLKLDNFLIFSEDDEARHFEVKIADFGHASRECGKANLSQQIKKFRQKIQEYSAPELLQLQQDHQDQNNSKQQLYGQQKGLDEKKTDIFSLGVSLFMAVIWRHPFRSNASQHDKIYQHIFNKKYSSFWNVFAKPMMRVQKNNNSQMVQHFQNLVQEMLSAEQGARPTIQQVMEHPFFKKMSQ